MLADWIPWIAIILSLGTLFGCASLVHMLIQNASQARVRLAQQMFDIRKELDRQHQTNLMRTASLGELHAHRARHEDTLAALSARLHDVEHAARTRQDFEGMVADDEAEE